MNDNDLINRSKLLEKSRTAGLYDAFVNEYPPKNIVFSEDVIGAPAVDAVTVVRCCDCKYGEFDLINQGYPEPPACEGMLCHKHNTKMDFTDFCSYGEPKEQDGNN